MPTSVVPPPTPAGVTPRRWDLLVRFTHWGVAAAVVANGLATKPGSFFHIWIGYSAGVLLALRLLWGLVGSSEARFRAFPPSPGRALAHVRDIAAGRPSHHRSHNPLGALMVYAIWATLVTVVATGVVLVGPPPLSPPAAPAPQPAVKAPVGHEASKVAQRTAPGGRAAGAKGAKDLEDSLGEVHGTAANLLFVLAALHLVGVAFETRRNGHQVVGAMLGGSRRIT